MNYIKDIYFRSRKTTPLGLGIWFIPKNRILIKSDTYSNLVCNYYICNNQLYRENIRTNVTYIYQIA